MRRYLLQWLIAAVVGGLSVACASTPERTFSDADLLIDPSALPSGWTLNKVRESLNDAEGQESGASMDFYMDRPPYVARAVQRVYRYSRAGKAAWHYGRFEKSDFYDGSVYRTSPWETPIGFSLSSANAAQWRFACAGSNFSTGPEDGRTSTLCEYLGQYDEFLVSFVVTVRIDDQEFLTTADLTSVVEAIDRKMVEYLHPVTQPR